MATYVGTNEAGVASTVSREVKEEITNGDFADEDDEEPTYQLSYLGSLYEEEVQVQTIEGSAFDKIMSSVQEVLPEASEEGFKATPYGLGILIALGTTFLVLCYVIFVKSDSAEKVKEKINERAEKRKAKKKALGEEDEEKQADDMDYCYDLESMNEEEEDEGEEGLEICSTFSFGSAKVGAASVFSKDSGRTKKMSNRSDEVTYDDAQKLDSLMEDEDAEDGSSTGDKAAISPSPSEDPSSSNENGTPRRVSRVNAGCSFHSDDDEEDGSPLKPLAFVKSSGPNMVDRTPSSSPSISSADIELSPTSGSGNAMRKLPSISEAELPPPMNDTPHVSRNRSRNRTEDWSEWEV